MEFKIDNKIEVKNVTINKNENRTEKKMNCTFIKTFIFQLLTVHTYDGTAKTYGELPARWQN